MFEKMRVNQEKGWEDGWHLLQEPTKEGPAP